jgi:DNA modification methylase
VHLRCIAWRSIALAIDNPLSIERLSIDEFILDPGNTRQHSERQINQIALSMKSFGNNVPVLIDSANRVRAGTGRVLAGRTLGLHELPAIRLAHLTEAQAKAFSVADNRLAETSTWNDRLLAETLKDLSDADLTFSLEATGFTMGEIDLRIEGLSDNATNDSDDPADALPEALPQTPISKLGDLWSLDRHRVLCGNALDTCTYDALMQGDKAAMVFTDPPYNVPIDGHVSGLGAIHHREFAMAAGEMTDSEFAAFLIVACGLLARHSRDGAIHFVCMDWRHADALLAAGKASYSELKNVCVWVKHNAGMGSFYRSQHELIFVFKAGRGPHRNNIQLGRYGRHRSNVWSYSGVNSFSRATDEGHLLALHPTVKPVRLVADSILDCSARGDIVLDGFLGSGTTIVAAERTGRRGYGLEIDPLYIDTTIRRWQAYTGEQARHAVTGETFSAREMEVERDNQ